MDWQPIETAPKDGTWIIVWDNDCDAPEIVLWDETSNQWTITAYWGDAVPHADIVGEYAAAFPTHWMPLPEAPQQEGR